MTTLDHLLETAIENPNDRTLRGALADALREVEEFELASIIESKGGIILLDKCNENAEKLKLPANLKLLWFTHVVQPRLSAELKDATAGLFKSSPDFSKWSDLSQSLPATCWQHDPNHPWKFYVGDTLGHDWAVTITDTKGV